VCVSNAIADKNIKKFSKIVSGKGFLRIFRFFCAHFLFTAGFNALRSGDALAFFLGIALAEKTVKVQGSTQFVVKRTIQAY
jgi:hypothetical protein